MIGADHHDLALIGWGHALPGPPRSQADILAWLLALSPEHAAGARTARALFRRAGVARRHMVIDLDGDPLFVPTRSPGRPGPDTAARMARYAADAPALGAVACRAALTDAGVAPADIAHLVTVSCTGAASPGLDIALIDALGLPATTPRSHVGFMGCHGAFNGLKLLAGLGRLHPGRPLLMCPVELCSLHTQLGGRPQSPVAEALFADGAAAVVARHGGDDHPRHWRLEDTASCLLPGDRRHLTWELGSHGFIMGLSAALPERIAAGLGDWLGAWLDRHDLAIENVGSWAVHPGGPRILDSVRSSLCLPPAAIAESRAVLESCGNMSSATVLLILDRLRRQRASRPCVALGFGPGPVAEAALFR